MEEKNAKYTFFLLNVLCKNNYDYKSLSFSHCGAFFQTPLKGVGHRFISNLPVFKYS